MNNRARVETYSSYAYAVAPRAFYSEGLRHGVQEIQSVWKTPGQIHFYLRDEHDRFFELTFDERVEEWSLRTFGETCRVAQVSTTAGL